MRDHDFLLLRNVLVMVIVDGKVTEAERELVHSLRKAAGIDAEHFHQLCEDVRKNRKRLDIPTAGAEAEEMLRSLLAASKADGEISASEQRILERVSQFIDRSATELEEIVTEAPPTEADAELEAQIERDIEQLYAHFAEWTDEQRCKHCRQLGGLGDPAVIPLLHVMESYREPEGGGGLEMKELIADQLAAIGDDRVVYYLAQQVSLGDTDDEVTSASLRAAAAEAVGRIVGEPFTRDEAGVMACRQWWAGEGTAKYRTLVL